MFLSTCTSPVKCSLGAALYQRQKLWSNVHSYQSFLSWLWHQQNELTVAVHSIMTSYNILTVFHGRLRNDFRVPLHWPIYLPSMLQNVNVNVRSAHGTGSQWGFTFNLWFIWLFCLLITRSLGRLNCVVIMIVNGTEVRYPQFKQASWSVINFNWQEIIPCNFPCFS